MKTEPCIEIGLKEIYDKVLEIDKKLDIAETNKRQIKIIYTLLTIGGGVLGFVISILLSHIAIAGG